MPIFHLIILALVQGITEFLPISSSGHLVIAHEILGHTDEALAAQNKILDIAVHLGTLLAVCAYFWRDLWRLIKGGFDILLFKNTENRKKSLLIILASLPVIIAGFIINMFGAEMFDHVIIIGWTTLIFGVVLWLIDEKAPQDKAFETMGYKHALLIGLSQILALIPGTSRSGITMIAARGLHYSRIEAARFSLLLGVVAISGAGALKSLDLINDWDSSFALDLGMAAAFSFISALIAIALMMKWLAKASFKPFAIYRIVLGLALLGLVYSGAIT
jgi:undecaprenyl-diphosphatase